MNLLISRPVRLALLLCGAAVLGGCALAPGMNFQ
jgi:hypothetical protein